MAKIPKNERPLNQSQMEFARLVASGLKQGESYLKAYPRCHSVKSSNTKSQLLLSDHRVQAEIRRLQKATETPLTLSVQEKREFLARVVRADVTKIDPDDPNESNESNGKLLDSVNRSFDKDGNQLKTTVKMVSKIQAIEADNKLAGHNSPEEHNLNVGGGVMLVPMGGITLNEWEKEAVAQQEAMKDTKG